MAKEWRMVKGKWKVEETTKEREEPPQVGFIRLSKKDVGAAADAHLEEGFTEIHPSVFWWGEKGIVSRTIAILNHEVLHHITFLTEGTEASVGIDSVGFFGVDTSLKKVWK